jgi:hypothetical protein
MRNTLNMGLKISYGPKGIARVQFKLATTGATNASTLAVTLDAAPIKGNIVFVAVVNSSGSGIVVGKMNDQTAIAWTFYGADNTSGVQVILAIGKVYATGASATLTFTGDASRPTALVAAEYSGLNIREEGNSQTTGNSTAPQSIIPASGITFVGELGIGALGCRGQYASVGANPFTVAATWTMVGQQNTNNNTANNDRGVALVEKFFTQTGSNETPGASITSNLWAAVGMSFYEAPFPAPNAYIG